MKIKHISPLLCVMCRYSACYEELPVCHECLNEFKNILTAECKNCGKSSANCDCPNNDNVRFLFFYEGYRVQRLIYFVKTNVDVAALDFLAELLFKNCGLNPEKFDAVTYVPRQKRAIRRYGHDQAKELAKAVSRVYGIPFVTTLDRVGKGEQKLLSAEARYKNIKNKYKLTKGFPKEEKFKRVLLVDDVCTTGATLRACSELLRLNVSESVVPVVLAKTNYIKK